MHDIRLINSMALRDPLGLCRRSEAGYFARIDGVVNGILDHLPQSRIALLCGPSSAGKTTTANNIKKGLARHGVPCEVISLDDYYRDVDGDYPKNADGSYDFEHPDCLDIPLLCAHMDSIERGDPVEIPRFSFTERRRLPRGEVVDPDSGVVLFEGIHALNRYVMGDELDRAFGIYIRISGEVGENGSLVLAKNQMRLCRRLVRDRRTRGTQADGTIAMWPSVRAGEHKYIMPCKSAATLTVDSFHPCEPGVLRPLLFSALEGVEGETAEALRRSYGQFEPIDATFVAENSLLREFIGDVGKDA